MGDHIICNGLVNSICESEPQTTFNLICKKMYQESVEFMYRDNDRIIPIPVENDYEAIRLTESKSPQLIKLGFEFMDVRNELFDKAFYSQVGVDFRMRWDNFKLKRDVDSELELFRKYEIKESEYVFIHDDKTRECNINESFIVNSDLKIIRPNHSFTKNIFDYCYLLENASELHFMDSSFRLLYDSIGGNQKLCFYHLYAKGLEHQSNSKKKYIKLFEPV